MFTLPKLPYAYDALEPYFDKATMEIHHTKHHQTYIDKLNKALDKHPEWKGKSVETLLTSLQEVPEDIRVAVRNHGGGHYNHCLFWTVLGPKAGGNPSGEISQAIDGSFGNFQTFKEKFTEVAVNHFASGWAWACQDKAGKIVVRSMPEHDCPLTIGLKPLFVLDVWEHAYYLKFQNRRPEFVTAFWNVIDWKAINQILREGADPIESAA